MDNLLAFMQLRNYYMHLSCNNFKFNCTAISTTEQEIIMKTKFLPLLFSLILLGAQPLFAKTTVTVSITPQAYFVEKIAGDLVNVSVMVPPGASPATYEPKPVQMAQLNKSSIYFAIGAPFEKAWIHKMSSVNSKMIVVKTQQGIELQPIVAHNHHDDEDHDEHDMKDEDEDEDVDEEDHDHHGHHNEEEAILDPHIWLAPNLVKIQAFNIKKALQGVDPSNSDAYEKGYQMFAKELEELDQSIKNTLRQIKSKKFMVFHPSWGYFAKEYGLKQVAVEVEGKEPGPKELHELIHEAREENIKVVFVAPQFSQKAARVIARNIGGNTVTVNPLAKDWDANLRQVAAAFQSVLEK
jgi:zinc transport system substrate-binding protein